MYMSLMIRLVMPTMEYEDGIRDFRREFLDSGSKAEGSGNLLRYEDTGEWLDYLRIRSSADTAPAGTVPFTQYIAVREEDGKVIGALQIRHYLKGDFALYAGHIGYSVRPSERRKGYGTQMLRLALQRCRDMGIDRVMISCVDTNEASRRTILKCGGVFYSTYYYSAADQTIEKYWIAL